MRLNIKNLDNYIFRKYSLRLISTVLTYLFKTDLSIYIYGHRYTGTLHISLVINMVYAIGFYFPAFNNLITIINFRCMSNIIFNRVTSE